MSDTYEIENNAIDGEDEMGSLNHSAVQSNLTYLLKCETKCFVATELSLDISQYDLSEYELGSKNELKPDVCAYLKRPVIPKGKNDLLKVSQMPDLVIEILSPRQSVDYLIRKIKAYFELAVRSCWLVDPSRNLLTLYSSPNQYQTFTQKDINFSDKIMDIQLPIKEIFEV